MRRQKSRLRGPGCRGSRLPASPLNQTTGSRRSPGSAGRAARSRSHGKPARVRHRVDQREQSDGHTIRLDRRRGVESAGQDADGESVLRREDVHCHGCRRLRPERVGLDDADSVAAVRWNARTDRAHGTDWTDWTAGAYRTFRPDGPDGTSRTHGTDRTSRNDVPGRPRWNIVRS